ncbi:hypothetical protein PGTUg99_025327 [Puccinia graminis f. sp. tritici]|uniref:Uncharacterized protein n=1 Tax=Puccinia graminis f. sp. tritici TaxID=56615 RepID=A0A5B0N0Z0_PUCGR|nr:hypothetical protein PGTUg99_025327 [Puccinia graminis f. sp. tritici]
MSSTKVAGSVTGAASTLSISAATSRSVGTLIDRLGISLKARVPNNSRSTLEMGPAHPDIRSDSDIPSRFQPNQTSASPGGYPLALAGIRADTRGYPPQK